MSRAFSAIGRYFVPFPRASPQAVFSLRYEISTLPDRFQELDYNNHEVYITLHPSGPAWEVQDVGNVPPARGMPYLKGHCNGREIKYGIERYYVPEGKGKNVPNDLYAQIVIQPGGIAQLKKLYSDGNPWPKQLALRGTKLQ